ncbi:hypothetical protein [Lacibacter sp.]|uniref:hypothetical protein n=1 Tax=Lacibacter sp. TaxID=1915409 RepID=UPI002B4ABA51|nr:hypothetical protein [Lacibacter sp.]
MRNWNNFCGMLIILLLISLAAKGQQADSVKVKKEKAQIIHSSLFNKYNLLQPLSTNHSKKISTNLGSPFAHWGFMCIGEYKLEQKTGIPLRVRLGSLDYVNKLEGKQ